MPRVAPARASDPFCPVYDAIAVLQGKWTMQIVHALIEGPMGFNELARAIGGCNPSTLAQRLDTLVRLDVLARRVESSTPPRTLYSLTPAGDALRPVVVAIEQWGRQHLRKDRVQAVRRAARTAREARAS
ncbi:helix-turn-helix domain-containing protein [Luteitalea sp.]|uniref:winged helix-turn-helix transcriptional regulator n=1 Tax=Luteitalea sp. TaxID=2004800 RepID=UPI0025BBFAC8|nr:helix-turn-helix domain-containing protein [Luteitalea sp.]